MRDMLFALGRSSLEAGILVAAILAIQFVLKRRLSPRLRSALWMLVVARLMLPVSVGSAFSVFNALPRWSNGAGRPDRPISEPEPSIDAPKLETTESLFWPSPFLSVSTDSATAPDTLARADQFFMPHSTAVSEPKAPDAFLMSRWAQILFWVWIGGVVVILGRVIVGSIRLAKELGIRSPVTDKALVRALNDCRVLLGVRARLMLAESESVTTPALYGAFRPCLILPKGLATRFSEQELRFIFLHELAHLKRWDLFVNWVVVLAQALHWFNPLVWLAFARWRADRESACDAVVLEISGAETNKEYGRTILRLMEGFASRAPVPGLAGILETKDQLRARIQLIKEFKPRPRFPVVATVLVATFSMVFLTDALEENSRIGAARDHSNSDRKNDAANSALPAPDRAFAHTQPPGPVSATMATLNGMAVPNGKPASGWFEFGTSTNYGFSTPVQEIGDGYRVARLSARVKNLADGGLYHCHLVVRTATGNVTYGRDFQFTTGMAVASWGGAATGNGKVPAGLSNVVSIACGHGHSLALKADGTVITWGGESVSYSDHGQTNVPPGLSNVIAIAGGFAHSLAVKADGTVVAWGEYMGHTPARVLPGLSNVIAVAGGDRHSVALKADGEIVLWGHRAINRFKGPNFPSRAEMAEIAAADNEPITPPVEFTNLVAITSGSGRCIGLRADGVVVQWIFDTTDAMSTHGHESPEDPNNVVAVSSDAFTSLALKSNGTVTLWGNILMQDVPEGLRNVVAIAAGHNHSLALRADGSVVVWGGNPVFQDTADDTKQVPKELSQVVAIASGDLHCLALGRLRPSGPGESK